MRGTVVELGAEVGAREAGEDVAQQLIVRGAVREASKTLAKEVAEAAFKRANVVAAVFFAAVDVGFLSYHRYQYEASKQGAYDSEVQATASYNEMQRFRARQLTQGKQAVFERFFLNQTGKAADASDVQAFSEALAQGQSEYDAAIMAVQRAKKDPCEEEEEEDDDPRLYVTYTKVGPGGRVYSGRTSGYGPPARIVAARDRNHHMNEQGYGPARLDVFTTDRRAIRGREQQLVDYWGGAQSQGGTSGNAIRAVRANHPRRAEYDAAATAAFGRLPNRFGWTP